MTDTGRTFCLYLLVSIAALAIIIFACGEDEPTEPGGADKGGSIFFGTATDTNCYAFHDTCNEGQNNLIDIQWHWTWKNGPVKDSAHVQNQD